MSDNTNTLTLIERLKVAKTVGGGFDLSPDNVIWVSAALDQLRETRIRRGDAENVLLIKELDAKYELHETTMKKYSAAMLKTTVFAVFAALITVMTTAVNFG